MTGPKGFYRPVYLIVMVALLCLLACWGSAALMVRGQWHDAMAGGRDILEYKASRAAEGLTQAAILGNLALGEAVRMVNRPTVTGVLDTNGLERLAASLPGGTLSVVNAQGRAVYASGAAVPPRATKSRFQLARAADGGGAVLQMSASAGESTVGVEVPVSGLVLDKAYRLAVIGDDGGILYGDPSALDRNRSAESPAQVTARQTLPHSTTQVVVAVNESELLGDWRRDAMVIAVAVLALTLLLVPTLAVLARRMGRDHDSSLALTNANRELSRSNADLEQFAYVASHDLKEPLRNIASYVQLLQRRYQGKLDEDADAFIGYTVDGVRRMQMIINELLAYSRIGTGPLARNPVQTGAVVSAVLANLKSTIAEARAVVEVDGPLPVVLGDSGQLTSVFQNLLANALKYRREDVRPEVRVSVSEAGPYWRFAVVDNGIGIDPLYQRQIFELFKRLHTRDRYTGSGIGLAVCQRVIERHGGEIWVESVAGQGASFFFTLPKIG